MMAFIDSKGNQVQFGDWVAVSTKRNPELNGDVIGVIARIISLKETTKGVQAIGAYISLAGKIRAAQFDIAPADSALVMRADGSRP